MSNKRPSEPIAPANIPGQKLDPRIPPDRILPAPATARHRRDPIPDGS
jgi:hypothetical protein